MHLREQETDGSEQPGETFHGGQVRMMGWSPVAPSGQLLTYGHIRLNCDVVVSGGLGCSIVPFRLGVPPEIVQVTLGKPGLIVS